MTGGYWQTPDYLESHYSPDEDASDLSNAIPCPYGCRSRFWTLDLTSSAPGGRPTPTAYGHHVKAEHQDQPVDAPTPAPQIA